MSKKVSLLVKNGNPHPRSAESPLGVKTYSNPKTTMHSNSSWSSKVQAIGSLLLHKRCFQTIALTCSIKNHFSVSPSASFVTIFLREQAKHIAIVLSMVNRFSHVWLFVTPWLLCPWNSPGKNTRVGCISFSRGSFQPRDRTCVPCVSCIGRHVLYH